MAKLDFDAADLDLIARCQKAQGNISQLARLVRIMFWSKLAGVLLFTGVVVWMYATKGAAGVSLDSQKYLMLAWVWVFIMFIASRSVQFEEQAVRLICKMTEE